MNATRGYGLTSEPQTLEELSWFIVARFIHIMHTFKKKKKANVLGAATFAW